MENKKTITLPLEEYNEMLSEIKNLNKGMIKTIIANSFPYYTELISYKEKDLIIKNFIEEIDELKKELEEIKNRTLWQRILNTKPSN